MVADFLRTGVYDKNREFMTTTSPAMDILVSSNLERLIYDTLGKDCGAVKDLMEKLAACGKYEVGKEVLSKIRNDFDSGFSDYGVCLVALVVHDLDFFFRDVTYIAYDMRNGTGLDIVSYRLTSP